MTEEERLQRKERRQSRRGRSQPEADQPMRRRGSDAQGSDSPTRESSGNPFGSLNDIISALSFSGNPFSSGKEGGSTNPFSSGKEGGSTNPFSSGKEGGSINPFSSGKSDERQAGDKSSWWRNPFWGSGKSEDLDSMDEAQVSKLEADAVEMEKTAAQIRRKIDRKRRTFTIDGVKSRHKPLGPGSPRNEYLPINRGK